MNEHHEAVVGVVDALSVTTMIATVFHQLPDIAAIFTIVWTTIRIVETKTIRTWLERQKKS